MLLRLTLLVGAASILSGSPAKAQGYYGQPRDYEYGRPDDEGGGYEERDYPRHEIPGELHGLNAACQRGDREACVRFGWLLRENREHLEEWRRWRPEYFWWEER